MILMIDNYDSFVYNLVQYIREMGREVVVYRNDQIALEQVVIMKPSHIILSPGPCTPDEAGISLELVRRFAGKIPILGVCLGHQVIGQAFGARVVQSGKPMHGKTSVITHDGRGLYKGLPPALTVGRYHSLVISPEKLPSCLEITAFADNVIMGIRHRQFLVEGVQFHPESILTPLGRDILYNFLDTRVITDESVSA